MSSHGREQVNLGTTRQMSERSAVYFSASYQWDLDGQGRAYSGKLGVRLNW
jgi:outer membrane autotransporter protein